MTDNSWLDGVQPETAPAPEPIIPDFRAGEATGNHLGGRGRGLFTKDTQRKPRESRAQRPQKPAPPYREGEYTDALVEFYGLVAFIAMPFKPALAITIMGPCREATEENPHPPSVAENCAAAWDKAAKQSPTVRRMLAGFTATTVWGTLAAAHAPILASLIEGTPLEQKLNPAAAMEAMLKEKAERAERDNGA